MGFFEGECMRIVSSIYNLKQLNKFIGYIDCALLMTPKYSLLYENDFDIDKAISLCIANNIEPILSINKIMHPNDINEISNVLDKYKDKALFYISDLGVANLAIKKNIINKIIFNPETMITNYLDLDIYAEYGFNALAMSLEIPISDIKESYKRVNAKLFSQVFGHRLMFYSKRKLISLYEEKNNDTYLKNNLYLKEVTRNDYLPVIENDNGTLIYRSYLLSLLNNLDDLNFLEYAYLEPLYIDDLIYLKVLKIYNSYIKENISKEEAIKLLDGLALNIEDGFTYKDSVYQKEELKR